MTLFWASSRNENRLSETYDYRKHMTALLEVDQTYNFLNNKKYCNCLLLIRNTYFFFSNESIFSYFYNCVNIRNLMHADGVVNDSKERYTGMNQRKVKLRCVSFN